MPANATPTSTRKPKSLRSALTGGLPLAGLGARLAVAVPRRAGRAQAALQVVEDEADRRLGPGHRSDGAVAFDDDEDTPVQRGRLELHERRVADMRHLERPADERNGRLCEALGGRLVGDRVGEDVAVRVEQACGLDLA